MLNRIQNLKNPSLENAAASIKRALVKNKCLIIIGRCKVEYQGRARSILESGERMIMIKEDGATLIHRSTGYEPVNWQPPGCYFRIKLENTTLLLTAIRRNPPESLKIFIEQVHALFAMKMIDAARFDLHVSEKEMQEAILHEPEILEEGFKPIAYEKRVDPGFLDIYGLDSMMRFVIVEIKRVKAGKSAVLQLAKYVDEIRKQADRDVRGVLAAPQISKGVQRLLATLNLEYKKIDLERCAKVLTRFQKKKMQDYL